MKNNEMKDNWNGEESGVPDTWRKPPNGSNADVS